MASKMKRPAPSCAVASQHTLHAREAKSSPDNGSSSQAPEAVSKESRIFHHSLVLTKAGLGHFGVQYARAMGMRVIGIDGGDAKRDLCLSLGAEKFIDFTTTSDIKAEVMKITTYGAHGVIVFSATRAGYEQAPHLLRPNGTMVCVGLPKDPTVIAGAVPSTLVMKRLNVVGSVVGTLKEAEEVRFAPFLRL